MDHLTLEAILNRKLESEQIRDYVPNGLQIEGRSKVTKIITGVTASQNLIDAAIEADADAILVHHGYFWKSESPLIRGMKYRRIKALMTHGINLYAYHLPLDLHPTLGNNAQLGKIWGVEEIRGLSEEPRPLILQGVFSDPKTPQDLSRLLERSLQRVPLHSGDNAPHEIRRVAWCSGAAQDYLEEAADQGVDAYITGEVSERTIHTAREMGIHFYAAGHHATERCGVIALGEWLADNYSELSVQFIDDNNPV